MALYKRSSTEVVAEGECIPTHGTKLENRGTKMDKAESGRLSGKFAGAFVNTVAICRAEVE